MSSPVAAYWSVPGAQPPGTFGLHSAFSLTTSSVFESLIISSTHALVQRFRIRDRVVDAGSTE